MWDSSRLLVQALIARARRASPDTPSLKGQTILELGAGAGLSALCAATLGANVCATDLPHAIGLLRHNARRNGGTATICGVAGSTQGGIERQVSDARRVVCPSGHTLNATVAEHEDYICNVCGLADPLGGGIDEGQALRSCRLCDFDVCEACCEKVTADQQQAGKVEGGLQLPERELQLAEGEPRLPGWFSIQCEPELTKPELYAFDNGGSLILSKWDLLSEKKAAASEALEALRAHGVQTPPILVLAADVSCAESLVAPLAEALAALADVLPADAEAFLVHERRDETVDRKLSYELSRVGLIFHEEPIDELIREAALDDGAERRGDAKARLQLMRIPLKRH